MYTVVHNISGNPPDIYTVSYPRGTPTALVMLSTGYDIPTVFNHVFHGIYPHLVTHNILYIHSYTYCRPRDIPTGVHPLHITHYDVGYIPWTSDISRGHIPWVHVVLSTGYTHIWAPRYTIHGISLSVLHGIYLMLSTG